MKRPWTAAGVGPAAELPASLRWPFAGALRLVVGLHLLGAAASLQAAPPEHRSLGSSELSWPSREQVLRVVTLRDYNTRTILLGTTLLGACAGAVGTFTLLRRRALVGDVVSHAALPGIGIAFLVLERFWPGSGKSLPGLLAGATIAGVAGVGCTNLLRRCQRIREDAALAIVLSLFFGVGIALFTVIQDIPTGNAAGLHHFIYGKTASIVAADVRLIAVAALVTLVTCCLLFKEFSLLAFDATFAASRGWPVALLDAVHMGLVVAVTVIGLQSVGLLLVVALLIVPPAAARFWSDRLPGMTLASAAFGGLAAVLGVLTSALFPRLAAGAVIVLCGSGLFAASMLFGVRRGVVPRLLVERQVKRRIGRHHLLRSLFKCEELATSPETPIAWQQLASHRAWTARELGRDLRLAMDDGLVAETGMRTYRLTEAGRVEAARLAKNHRLWELYLIHYAHVAPTHVDRDADESEHFLDPAYIAELERLLAEQVPQRELPASPHEIAESPLESRL